MASHDQVRQYLAYWFQLGKRVVIHNTHETLQPQPVVQGDRYSPAFEDCWRRILDPETGDCYLESTGQTVQELLSGVWEIVPCVRCDMPVPIPTQGLSALNCPCIDLPCWPNTEVPRPRLPIDSQNRLTEIRNRLMTSGERASSASTERS